jgi:regulator of replication initiation timing
MSSDDEELAKLNAEHEELLRENAMLVEENQALRKENIRLRKELRGVEQETITQFYGLCERLSRVRSMLESVEVPEPFDEPEPA